MKIRELVMAAALVIEAAAGAATPEQAAAPVQENEVHFEDGTGDFVEVLGDYTLPGEDGIERSLVLRNSGECDIRLLVESGLAGEEVSSSRDLLLGPGAAYVVSEAYAADNPAEAAYETWIRLDNDGFVYSSADEHLDVSAEETESGISLTVSNTGEQPVCFPEACVLFFADGEAVSAVRHTLSSVSSGTDLYGNRLTGLEPGKRKVVRFSCDEAYDDYAVYVSGADPDYSHEHFAFLPALVSQAEEGGTEDDRLPGARVLAAPYWFWYDIDRDGLDELVTADLTEAEGGCAVEGRQIFRWSSRGIQVQDVTSHTLMHADGSFEKKGSGELCFYKLDGEEALQPFILKEGDYEEAAPLLLPELFMTADETAAAVPAQELWGQGKEAEPEPEPVREDEEVMAGEGYTVLRTDRSHELPDGRKLTLTADRLVLNEDLPQSGKISRVSGLEAERFLENSDITEVTETFPAPDASSLTRSSVIESVSIGERVVSVKKKVNDDCSGTPVASYETTNRSLETGREISLPEYLGRTKEETAYLAGLSVRRYAEREGLEEPAQSTMEELFGGGGNRRESFAYYVGEDGKPVCVFDAGELWPEDEGPAEVPLSVDASEEEIADFAAWVGGEVSVKDPEYVIADSSTRLLTREEVEALSTEDLQTAINEIFARHGYIFMTQSIRTYFESLSWYKGTVPAASFSESVFSETEKKNVKLMTEVRDSRK